MKATFHCIIIVLLVGLHCVDGEEIESVPLNKLERLQFTGEMTTSLNLPAVPQIQCSGCKKIFPLPGESIGISYVLVIARSDISGCLPLRQTRYLVSLTPK